MGFDRYTETILLRLIRYKQRLVKRGERDKWVIHTERAKNKLTGSIQTFKDINMFKLDETCIRQCLSV